METEKFKKFFFELTPLGKAEKDVRGFLEKRVPDEDLERYEKTLKQYRYMKVVQSGLKLLFYASVLTSIAATFGLDSQVVIFQQVASYVGTSILFLLYAVTSYITLIRRESYHVRREILISQAASG